MEWFQNKGSKQAIRLFFKSFIKCECCKKEKHILYYFHKRLACKRCLPNNIEVLHIDNIPKYKITKVR